MGLITTSMTRKNTNIVPGSKAIYVSFYQAMCTAQSWKDEKQSSYVRIGRQTKMWGAREWGACQKQTKGDKIVVFYRQKNKKQNLVLAKKIKRLQGNMIKWSEVGKKWGGEHRLSREEWGISRQANSRFCKKLNGLKPRFLLKKISTPSVIKRS